MDIPRLSREKAQYFWHRHLEGADPETRTLRKWNAAYPNDQTTLHEITSFIAFVQERMKLGETDAKAIYYVTTEGAMPEDEVTAKRIEKGKSHGRSGS